MFNFENKIVHGDFASRYIASWIKAGGQLAKRREDFWLFKDWLRSIGLSNEEVYEIAALADNGKLEYEESAKIYLRDRDERASELRKRYLAGESL